MHRFAQNSANKYRRFKQIELYTKMSSMSRTFLIIGSFDQRKIELKQQQRQRIRWGRQNQQKQQWRRWLQQKQRQ